MSTQNERPRTIAFYLPQFHAIPENDEWWGEGFTEWRNVARAEPAFEGHDHPRRPGPLGEYDLSAVDVMHDQAELAAANGVDAFCFYFYWFNHKRLLERPLENYLASGPDLPFCISWANENWSRRWDGKQHDVLMAQEYDAHTAFDVFEEFLPLLRDPRYVRVRQAALLLVHRVDHIPNPVAFFAEWRRRANEEGIGELHIVAAETRFGIDPREFGVDAVSEFPPVGSNTLASAPLTPPRDLDRSFRGRLLSYKRMSHRFLARPHPPFIRYHGVAPGWDNSARRGAKATVYVGSTPDRYARWLAGARAAEQVQRGADGLVFVNAWNEWAEGAYLEPDETHGDRYLRATGLDYIPDKETADAPSRPRDLLNPAWLRSVALLTAGSALNVGRRTSARLRRVQRG